VNKCVNIPIPNSQGTLFEAALFKACGIAAIPADTVEQLPLGVGSWRLGVDFFTLSSGGPGVRVSAAFARLYD
jgi:hypothetical protein